MAIYNFGAGVDALNVSTGTSIEPAWKTYPRAVLFSLPAVGAYVFTCILLLPKLKELWFNAGFDNPGARTVTAVFVGWSQHYFIIALALATLLALLEWRSSFWRTHRRLVCDAGVFLANAAVIFFLASLLTFALMAVSHLPPPAH